MKKSGPSRKPPIKRHTARSQSLPAPVGGWNARDAKADMDPADAIELINWFPKTTTCQVRFGYSDHATGLGGQCETVMSYQGGATSKLFAAVRQPSTSVIYDVTTAGAVGSADLSSLSNARWQHVNFSTSGGAFLVCANGADSVRNYNGSAWSTPSITGVTSSTLVHVNSFKNRLWFIENNTLQAWYLPTQSISGAAAALDLRAFCPHGGYLMAMGTWTIDAGYGVDDHAVFITSEGDVLVYRGTDPSSASTWALVGVWWLGSPIGRRCFVKYKGDLLLLTTDGVLPLSGALQSSRLNPRVALTDKIQQAQSEATQQYGTNFGWQMMPFSQQNMLIVNVPVQAGSQEQYVMNMITGAWGRFQGWPANCWEVYGDDVYFGANNIVALAWDTNADDGDDIETKGLQAFNYFGSRGQLKRFTMMRPTFQSDGQPSIQGSINVDFSTADPASSLQVSTPNNILWDAAVWDQAQWGGSLIPLAAWQGATGVGYCGAPRFATMTNDIQLEWVSTEVVYEPGGIVG